MLSFTCNLKRRNIRQVKNVCARNTVVTRDTMWYNYKLKKKL